MFGVTSLQACAQRVLKSASTFSSNRSHLGDSAGCWTSVVFDSTWLTMEWMNLIKASYGWAAHPSRRQLLCVCFLQRPVMNQGTWGGGWASCKGHFLSHPLEFSWISTRLEASSRLFFCCLIFTVNAHIVWGWNHWVFFIYFWMFLYISTLMFTHFEEFELFLLRVYIQAKQECFCLFCCSSSQKCNKYIHF